MWVLLRRMRRRGYSVFEANGGFGAFRTADAGNRPRISRPNDAVRRAPCPNWPTSMGGRGIWGKFYGTSFFEFSSVLLAWALLGWGDCRAPVGAKGTRRNEGLRHKGA